MKKKKTTSYKEDAITGSETFMQVLQKYPQSAAFFFEKGMFCIGCPAATDETVEQGILAHGKDPKKIIQELNSYIKKHAKPL